MTRPIEISRLLGGIKKANNVTGDHFDKPLGNKIVKPKFLSKSERNLTENSVNIEAIGEASFHDEYNNIVSLKKNRSYNDSGDIVDANDNSLSGITKVTEKKKKFQFDWRKEDDTLTNYKPIVNINVSELLLNKNLKTSSALDSLEDSYMGKHWREKSYKEMTDRDWRIVREDFNITTKGGNSLHPLRSWNEHNIIPDDMLKVLINKLNFKEPTPIQRIAIPNVCKQSGALLAKDFMGIASTGSGKTLSFAIPILIKLNNSPPRPQAMKVMEGPRALILAPTRELAQQIQTAIQSFTDLWGNKSIFFTSLSVVGGHSTEELSYQLSNGCDILVATPGRLIDCLESHLVILSNVDTLVLDEADKMIDLGFEDQLTTILSYLEASKAENKMQTIMFSATMSPTIERIANNYLYKPSYATIGASEDFVPQIHQIVEYSATEDQRFSNVRGQLDVYGFPAIIFINYKKTADWLMTKFQQETGYKITVLHGSKSQDQREQSLDLLRTGKAQVLIATNVAARGIDIPNVSLVVNFQMSSKFEDYVHRIGRTGRAGAKGTAITYLGDEEDPKIVEELNKYLKQHNTSGQARRKDNEFSSILSEKYNLKTSKKYIDDIIL